MKAADSTPIRRFATESVLAALDDTPVVMVIGPRQSGKTTLVRELIGEERAYFTLDDDLVQASARSDPAGFVRGLNRATIDEIQRAPDLLRAIKLSVDRDRRPGRFLLTGSANVLALPTVSDSLAGRMAISTLLPLSPGETMGRRPTFLERAFAGDLVKPANRMTGRDLMDAVLTGGYPEMVRRKEPARRTTWARDYVTALVQRDVRDISGVEKLDHLPRLLQMLACHAGQLINFSQAGGQIGLDDKSTRKYVAVFEQLFLVRQLRPWFRNGLARLVKTAKLHFVDSGLLAAVQGLTAERTALDRTGFGSLLETFVFAELLKQGTWHDGTYTFSHYRDKDQDEVDFVIENERGQLVGVEVKAAATVRSGDFKGLRKLASAGGEDFRLGVLLYDGENTVPFGDRLFAAPVSCAWGHN